MLQPNATNREIGTKHKWPTETSQLLLWNCWRCDTPTVFAVLGDRSTFTQQTHRPKCSCYQDLGLLISNRHLQEWAGTQKTALPKTTDGSKKEERSGTGEMESSRKVHCNFVTSNLLSIHWTLFYPLMFLLIRQTWKQQRTFEIHWEQWRGKLAKPGLGLRGGDEDLSEGRRSQAWLHGDLWQTTDLQCKVCTWIPNHIKKSQNKTPQTLGFILVESLLLQYLWALTWARCAFYSHTGLSATLDPPLSSREGKSDLPECLSHLSRLHASPKLW